MDMVSSIVFISMSIIHLENNHRKINTLEEIEILKAASSKYLLNDAIAGQNDPIYKLFDGNTVENKGKFLTEILPSLQKHDI